MLFHSFSFLLFFPLVTGMYFLIPKRAKQLWLLVASYYFYMSWNVQYGCLILLVTAIGYGGGLLLAQNKVRQGKRRLAVLTGSVLLCVGILFFFKYSAFAVQNINELLRAVGSVRALRVPDLILPVGISFYTFQTIGYLIDVWKGKTEAEKSFLRFALFVSFFPQLVAGPIERSKNLLNQMRSIDQIQVWDAKRVASGGIFMVWGLFMKMVIADRIAIPVDTVFNNFRMYGGTEIALAAVGFAIQIYCDFGSYSMIAIGAAKVMGFQLMENFNTPYFAVGIRDFWGRWHISLSTWFRDYLYIPLGGNRRGKFRKAVNIMIVFLTSGLWHGADWSFVLWGGIHGFYQVIEDVTEKFRNKLWKAMNVKTDCFSWKFLQMTVTFVLVVFAWIFFRADSIRDALGVIKRIVTCQTPWVLFDGEIYNLGLDRIEMNILIVSLVILFLVDLVRYLKKQTLDVFLMSQNLWFEWFAVIGLIVMIFIFGEYGPTFDPQQFIYFQF